MATNLKKFLIEDLNEYIDRTIIVKLIGGREVKGLLKSYDNNFNLVLKGGADWEYNNTLFCFGASVVSICIE
ncbi:Small Nuclear ribonucleoprotein splicing factor [Trachipleistophora hominis]|uniref:Small Nuclear ribonucleoprotein splicing factor n=1 Tax=Trachipleistophora hominis TaxID=72359 RepID=L7JSN9_TRAHO|nr:Small Nuclear ribonucleoprotein splicing factor [Trachipleistophora hominis]